MTTPNTAQAAQVTPNTEAPKPNGAPPAVAAPVVPTPPAEDPRIKELETQTKRFALQQRKLSEDRAALQKAAAESKTKLKEYEDWQAYQQDKRRNPAKYLEKEYGPEWYDTLTKVKVEGAPTADLIASEMDSRLSDFEKKLKTREEEVEKRFEELKQQEQERSISEWRDGVIKNLRSAEDKYPYIAASQKDGSEQSVIFEIQNDFRKKSENSNGEPIEALTWEEAANRVEKRIEDIYTRLEAAKQKKQSAATQPPATTQRSETPQRRTLSTDMTASSGTDWVPPKDDKERMSRATAAWERARQPKQ